MKVFTFSLWIPRDEMLAYYEGRARRISVVADNGLRIELPAEAFRRFVGHQGIKGRFRAVVSDEHRLIDLQRSA